MNTLGQILTLTTFGESHGPAIGGVLDGFPSGITVDMEYVRECMQRRRPGQSTVTTGRQEQDEVEFLSGLLDGVTTGAPIAFIIRNTDQHSSDYDELKDIFRPSHADYAWLQRYGIRDWRGGGRSSARVTAPICAAGALSTMALRKMIPALEITAFTSQIGPYSTNPANDMDYSAAMAEKNAVRCPDSCLAAKMEEYIHEMRSQQDSTGGCVTCIVRGLPAGIGNPVFDKLEASLAKAMLGINAAKGFEYGDGFASASQRGSEHNDAFCIEKGRITTATNHSGGIQGGISNGSPIRFRVAFKPTPTIGQEQHTVTIDGKETTMEAKGRHDPCVVPRAVPIVESLTALVILDQYLTSK
ncbi:MAG: chorismate synthase [Bacteroidaceae bacterium]|nr:chorismate synthase [Bacteroidaceae bacterium]